MSQVVLAIDTALNACSVAIMRGDDTLVARVEPMARGQAERLASLVEALMAQAGLSFHELDRIAVTRGPGAFTGLRVGLAFARGLALAIDRPCIGLSTLQVLAVGARQPRTVAAISVAGSLFVGAWERQNQMIEPCRAEQGTILDGLSGDWALTGPGAASLQALRPHWPLVHQEVPDPVVLAQLALHADPTTHAPNPLYLRGVEAKLPGGLLLPESSL